MIQRINKKHEKSSSRKSSGFVYKERSADSVKKRAEQEGGRFDSIFKSGFDTFKPKSGTNVVRFLPPTWDGHDHYGLDIYVHGFVGPNRGSYLCLQKMKNKPCPLCKLEEAIRKDGDNEEANKVAARKRVLTWIIDRDGDDSTPLLWSMGWTTDRDISDLARNKRTGETLLIDHPDEGYDVSFTRKGERLNTDYYGWQIDRDTSPIADKQKDQDEILEYIQGNPLPEVLHYVSAEKLQQVVDGTVEEPDEDEEEEEKPRKKDGKAKHRDEDEEEEEEEEVDEETGEITTKKKKPSRRDDDDDEEEEEAPPKKKARRSRDEDEEEEEEEEEVEEKPAKRVRTRPAKDEEEEEEEEEEEAPPKKKARRRDEDEEEEEEEEEEERPRKKTTTKRRRDDDDEEEEEDE